jgi:hypothetical protein
MDMLSLSSGIKFTVTGGVPAVTVTIDSVLRRSRTKAARSLLPASEGCSRSRQTGFGSPLSGVGPDLPHAASHRERSERR